MYMVGGHYFLYWFLDVLYSGRDNIFYHHFISIKYKQTLSNIYVCNVRNLEEKVQVCDDCGKGVA
jgi:hypothetical protein